MNVAEELKKARAGGYAVGAFNTANLEVTKAICAAAAKFNHVPILIQTTPSAIEYAGLKTLYNIVTNEITSSGINATIHLDHAKEFEIVKQAIAVGYKSVMFDGSDLPFEENILWTGRVVELARKNNVAVEAEVGFIGHEEGGQISGSSKLSNPEQVQRFIDETGIDSVAVSVGNEHGAPEGEKVNFEVLKKIADIISIPLVMHGSSGLSDGDIREAMGLGVAKFNIDTNIRKAFSSSIEHSNEADYRKALEGGIIEVEKVVERYIKLFTDDIFQQK